MRDLGSSEGIAKAKFEIIDGLEEDGKLFYDGDEPLLRALVNQKKEIQSISFGYSNENALSLKTVE